jgi:phosphoglycerol transferase MdoB-like AlkP superfamily enzyme
LHKKNTYCVLFYFVLFFVLASFIVRATLLFISFSKAEINILSLLSIFGKGLLFDIGVASFFVAPYSIYLLLLPAKRSNSFINRAITYTAFFLVTLILSFSFFAEFTFWNEFESRFNFIAVDYLIYTYEVINNINQSYPLPLLIGGMLAITLLVIWLFNRRKIFAATFNGNIKFTNRLIVTVIIILTAALYAFKINSSLAETSSNRYQNELSKAGIYSFFAAFKNNELNYEQFYQLISNEEAFSIIRNELKDSGTVYLKDDLSVKRHIADSGKMIKPNVIMITIESLSADFLKTFGNTQSITPVLDSLVQNSVLFTNLYATGTRTVRGMEALSLAISPTPGSSIVRRPNNDSLFTIGHIFREQGYETGFFYGGDGYFDNMNQYFGSNGYAVTDRSRNLLATDNYKSTHTIIPDSLVNFENAWGISDEDLYSAVIRDADAMSEEGKLFYDFVMTTSNHQPYTYPSGKIDIPSGTGREGAVKYTDFAIGEFINKIKTKPWFNNTIIIFIADHCASSAGRNEIDIAKYHIPAIIYNLPDQPALNIPKICSQVDLYPTLFSLLHWQYNSNLYGKNALSEVYQPRALLGTYQKLAYMKNDSLVILSPQQKVETFRYNKVTNEQTPAKDNEQLVKEAIAYYQTAYFLFKNNGLKQ